MNTIFINNIIFVNLLFSNTHVFQKEKATPRLLHSFRFPLQNGNYTEIGILPKLDRKFRPQFVMSMAIVADKNYLLLNDVEVANFFHFLRQQDKFAGLIGEDEYFDDVLNNFEGVFRVEENNTNIFDIIYMDEKYDWHGVGGLSYDEIETMLENEVFLNNQIHRIRYFIEKLHDELNDLVRLIRFKNRKIDNVKSLLQTEAMYNGLAAEMVANYFDFFTLCKPF